VPEAALRRHDLVWLGPAASLAQFGLAEQDHSALRDWMARRLPLVVGRQDGQPGGLRLGFTLPGCGPRRRVTVRAPRAAIVAHGPPPAVEAMLRFAPEPWQPSLQTLARAFSRTGLIARAYGSLVTQAFSGEACMRPGSDVDVLIDCACRAEALAAVAVFARQGDGPPRIDGELRMSHGWAVAWRELARSLDVGGQVLAKSDTALQLMSPDEFLGAPIPIGAIHASRAHAPAAAGRPA
jgi:phosphoribosyl-dephospho-CoA transferase